MRRLLLALAGIMLAFAVQASDSVRFGSSVVTVGDSESTVLRAAGTPERRVKVETKYGGAAGYRLDYQVGRRTVQIYIEDGRVAAIADIY